MVGVLELKVTVGTCTVKKMINYKNVTIKRFVKCTYAAVLLVLFIKKMILSDL